MELRLNACRRLFGDTEGDMVRASSIEFVGAQGLVLKVSTVVAISAFSLSLCSAAGADPAQAGAEPGSSAVHDSAVKATNEKSQNEKSLNDSTDIHTTGQST